MENDSEKKTDTVPITEHIGPVTDELMREQRLDTSTRLLRRVLNDPNNSDIFEVADHIAAVTGYEQKPDGNRFTRYSNQVVDKTNGLVYRIYTGRPSRHALPDTLAIKVNSYALEPSNEVVLPNTLVNHVIEVSSSEVGNEYQLVSSNSRELIDPKLGHDVMQDIIRSLSEY